MQRVIYHCLQDKWQLAMYHGGNCGFCLHKIHNDLSAGQHNCKSDLVHTKKIYIVCFVVVSYPICLTDSDSGYCYSTVLFLFSFLERFCNLPPVMKVKSVWMSRQSSRSLLRSWWSQPELHKEVSINTEVVICVSKYWEWSYDIIGICIHHKSCFWLEDFF